VKDSNTPRWNNRTAKYITAQAVFDARAVERPWMDRELVKIASRNNKYGWAQQPTHAQNSNQDCRRMHLNRWLQGKTNTDQRLQPTSKATEEEDATDIRTRTPKWQSGKEVDRTRDQHQKRQEAHATITQYAIEKATRRGMEEGREMQKTQNAIEKATLRGIEEQNEMQKQRRRLTCQGCKQRRNNYIRRTDEQCWYNTPSPPSKWCTWCKKQSHTTKICWERPGQKAKRTDKESTKQAEQNTTQMKEDKTKDFANGGW
jgi:hypothetical protein